MLGDTIDCPVQPLPSVQCVQCTVPVHSTVHYWAGQVGDLNAGRALE